MPFFTVNNSVDLKTMEFCVAVHFLQKRSVNNQPRWWICFRKMFPNIPESHHFFILRSCGVQLRCLVMRNGVLLLLIARAPVMRWTFVARPEPNLAFVVIGANAAAIHKKEVRSSACSVPGHAVRRCNSAGGRAPREGSRARRGHQRESRSGGGEWQDEGESTDHGVGNRSGVLEDMCQWEFREGVAWEASPWDAF